MNLGLRSLIAGATLGGVLSLLGFASWDEVHAMFTLDDFRLMLTFGAAVAILLPVFAFLTRRRGLEVTPRPYHRGSIAGGVLFGVGWAVCGACPGIVFVQLGQGQLGGLATLAGIFAGNLAFGVLNERFFRVPSASCAEG